MDTSIQHYPVFIYRLLEFRDRFEVEAQGLLNTQQIGQMHIDINALIKSALEYFDLANQVHRPLEKSFELVFEEFDYHWRHV